MLKIRKNENSIKLSKDQTKEISAALNNYMLENFQLELGNLESTIFADFISEKIGKFYYNKGVYDSISLFTDKIDDFYTLMKDEKI